MRLENFNFYCSNNFLLLHLNSDGIEDDNIQSLGHGLCLVKRRKLFTLCKIQSQRRNSAWGAEYPICINKWSPLLITPMLNSTSAGLHWLAQTHSVLVFYHKNWRRSTMECTLIFGFGSYPPKFIYEIPSKFHLRFPPIFVPCATKFPSFISL